MVLWSRILNRRGGLTFTIELRRYFAVKIIQNWWLSIKEKRAKRHFIENAIR